MIDRNVVDTKTPVGAALAKVFNATLNEAKHRGKADAQVLSAILTGCNADDILAVRAEAFEVAGYMASTAEVKTSMIRRLWAAAQTSEGRNAVEAMAAEGAMITSRNLTDFNVPIQGGKGGRTKGSKGKATADAAANDPFQRVAAWVTETQGLCATAVKLINGMSADDCSALKDLLSNMAEQARQVKALVGKYGK